jgi:acetyl-CoA carboxylase carboxyltransferase component
MLAESAVRVIAILREVLAGREHADWLDEDLLDELLVTTDTAFPAVAEWVRAVRARLFELDAADSSADPTLELDTATVDEFELWRLEAFDVTRRPAPRGVLLVHAVARDEPADERLFAFVRITDLTTEALERRLREAVAAIRQDRLGASRRTRPTANRVVATVVPPWRVTDAQLKGIAQGVADAAQGLELEKVLVRARLLDPGATEAIDTVVHMAIPHALGVSVGRSTPSDRPIASRTPYQQRVARLHGRGAVSPYEIVDLLVAPSARDADFPLGRFTEHDLEHEGDRLVPVERPYGHNSANLVVGLIENRTATHPEGMRRVILLGDPAKGLGALAEPECRRVIGALDLAEELDVPVEWFTVSSGAKVAMDSGTENLDWTAAALRRIIEFTQAGREINVVVVGVNVGAQAYFDAEATMLMHTRGALIMVPQGSMVLTGKQALDASGGVSAENNAGIGGFERVMGPNGQAQYWAADISAACATLFRYYETAYAGPGEARPRDRATDDPVDRDLSAEPHPTDLVPAFGTIGDVFSDEHNPDRKKPFEIRAVMRAVSDADCTPLERWAHWEGAETGIVWDTHLGGHAVTLLGIESQNRHRRGALPADGPRDWTAGTLFPGSSKKLARAINAASGNRPVVVLANLSGFDGSPESMRELQLEYGAELGRAVVNFQGPIVFCVLSRYHGGAFVVFSKRLNPAIHVVAVEGARASVLGGAPAASVVFTREVDALVALDPAVAGLTARLAEAPNAERSALRAELEAAAESIRAEATGKVAAQFDAIHTIERARSVGSIDAIVPIGRLRGHVIAQLEGRGAVQ